MSKDQPPTKELVKHLRPPNWGSNQHQTTMVLCQNSNINLHKEWKKETKQNYGKQT